MTDLELIIQISRIKIKSLARVRIPGKSMMVAGRAVDCNSFLNTDKVSLLTGQ